MSKAKGNVERPANAKPSEYVFLAQDEQSALDSMKSKQDNKPIIQIIPNPGETANDYFTVPKTAQASLDLKKESAQTASSRKTPIQVPVQTIVQEPAKVVQLKPVIPPPPQQQPNVQAIAVEAASHKSDQNKDEQYEPICDYINTPPPDITQLTSARGSASPQKPKSKQNEKAKSGVGASKQTAKARSGVSMEKGKTSKPWQIKFWKGKTVSKEKPADKASLGNNKIDDDSDLQSKVIVKDQVKKNSAESLNPQQHTPIGSADKTNLADPPVEKSEDHHHEHLHAKDKNLLIEELLIEWEMLQDSNRRSALILIAICVSIGLLLTGTNVFLGLTDFFGHSL